jgi:hypothetical protein
MDNNAARFVGSIPEYYDQGLAPMIFVDYAADIARRVAAFSPARVLKTAAGTGIVTRRLRDVLPAGSRLTVTDLNPPSSTSRAASFGPASRSSSSPPMPWRCPLPMAASTRSCANSA